MCGRVRWRRRYRIHGEINTMYDVLLSFYNTKMTTIEKMSACTSTIVYTRLAAADAIVDANQRQTHDGIPWSNGTCYLFTHYFQEIQRYRVYSNSDIRRTCSSNLETKNLTCFPHTSRDFYYTHQYGIYVYSTKFQNRFYISE